MEKAALEGKLTKALKSITGQHQYFYNVDSLLLPDGTITKNLIQIHDRLTEAFADLFICPQQHKHSPLQSDDDIDHERFLTDEDFVKSAVSKISDEIPTAAPDSVWFGISHVPKRPQLCTETEEIFNNDITEEEFTQSLQLHRPTQRHLPRDSPST